MDELRNACFFVRKKMRLTQYELARILRTNQTKVSLIENGYVPDLELQKTIMLMYDRLKGT